MFDNYKKIIIQGFINGEQITSFRLKRLVIDADSAIMQDKHFESRLPSRFLKISRRASRGLGQLIGYKEMLPKK